MGELPEDLGKSLKKKTTPCGASMGRVLAKDRKLLE
jgi:hypothetical protein